MKYMRFLFAISLLIFFTTAKGQTGHFNDFDDLANWSTGTGYTLTNPSGTEMQVAASGISSFMTFDYTFPSLDLTADPYLQVKMKTSSGTKIRIDFQDAAGMVTNGTPTTVTIPGNNVYSMYTFDFTSKFNQSWPGPATVNPAQITKILIYFNPGGTTGYTGTVFFDSLSIGSESNIPEPPKDIRINQVGFYPHEAKLAIAVQPVNNTFYLVSATKQDTVFTGTLAAATVWNRSGETVRKADFSAFDSSGTFYVSLDSGFSVPFKIAPKIHLGVTKGLLKSYYFHRASTAIEAPWGDAWLRAKGHSDNVVNIHASAATAFRPAGATFSSTRGWYDAGDYNKYMVNSGISTYTILAMYEHFPAVFDTLNTFIPESSNNIPDVLDEALWNVRWMLTAQDPSDGSVYHKVTDANFNGTTMPGGYSSARYAVQRSTSASLNFAAVMAQASRIFSNFQTELPELSDSCLNAAISAYNWAVANPTTTVTANAAGINTGVYGDGNVSDEFAWARMELYAATRNDIYYNRPSVVSGTFSIPSWPNVNTLGLITLVNYRKQLNTAGYADTTAMKNKLLALADVYKNHAPLSSYGVAMGQSSWNFGWGSNAVAGNQGMVMLQAFRLTQDSAYLKAALTNLDYLLGRNGTGYSFVTGFGTKYPMHPHDRISEADGIIEPIPGMVVGGPNPGQDDNCVGYPSSLPARSYVDTWCSYASNEPAINYAAPVAYLAGGIEAIFAGGSYTPPVTAPPLTGVKGRSFASISVNVFPNPTKEEFTVEFENKGTAKIVVSDVTGKVVFEESISKNNLVTQKLTLESLPQGIYFVSITNNEGAAFTKIVKQ